MAQTYCLDSSSIIAAWDERYPPDNFPAFWTQMDRALNSQLVLVPEAVLDELDKKSKDAAKWLKERSGAIVPYESDIQRQAREILADFPRLVATRKITFAADPFVIATAMVKGLTVVSEEGPTGNLSKPNIPDVCRSLNVKCIKLIGLIRAEGWIVG